LQISFVCIAEDAFQPYQMEGCLDN